MYNFSSFKIKLTEINDWLSREYLGIRTGRATPAVLDGVAVESYGARTPLKHLASINIEDACTIRISPWDRGQLTIIQSAINSANLGLSVSPDSTSLRVIFPTLTMERRNMLIKLTGEKLEEARISVKKEREKTWNDIQVEEKAGRLSEDEKFSAKTELQKLVDDINKKLEDLARKKEEEIKN